MPASLLDSQLATLEPHDAGEPPIAVSVDPPVDDIVKRIVADPIAIGVTGAVNPFPLRGTT